MEFKGKFVDYVNSIDGNKYIVFSVENKNFAAEVAEIKAFGEIDVKIKKHREKRSINANAYLWVLLEKMARKLGTDKDKIYLEMLERYGVFTHTIVQPHVVHRVKDQWKTVRELGEVTVNGKKGIQLQCYFGSSTYDKKEMARLLDGVILECKELEIETLDEKHINSLKEEWDNEH